MDSTTILVLWVAAAMFCYAIARRKGRDPLIAAASGLVFGFFALIYYLISKGSREYELNKAQEFIKEEKSTVLSRNKQKDYFGILLLVLAILIGIFVLMGGL